MNPENSTDRITLVDELIDIFVAQGFIIESAVSERGFSSPASIKNTTYGDQEDKIPDVIAYDQSEKQSIIGMVCVTESDIGSDATLTKFNVFLNCPAREKEKPARVFVIVPASKVAAATDVITHYLHPEYWTSIQIVSSKRLI